MKALVLVTVALLVWPRVHALAEGVTAARAAIAGIVQRTVAMQARARTRARWQIAGLALVAVLAVKVAS